jgi:hypothetical protein
LSWRVWLPAGPKIELWKRHWKIRRIEKGRLGTSTAGLNPPAKAGLIVQPIVTEK